LRPRPTSTLFPYTTLFRSREQIAAELFGELTRGVEREPERRVVRRDEHVGNENLSFQLGMLCRMPRILMVAHVVPRPSVERIFLHVRDLIGDQIVAERVAPVGREPQLSGRWVDAEA